jgi:hypothetical protein
MTYAPMYDLIEETIRPEIAIDVMRDFPETHQNTGRIISGADAEAEFKERVYAHGMAFCTQVRRSIYWDDDDDYYSDCDYDGEDYTDDGDDQYPYSDDDDDS